MSMLVGENPKCVMTRPFKDWVPFDRRRSESSIGPLFLNTPSKSLLLTSTIPVDLCDPDGLILYLMSLDRRKSVTLVLRKWLPCR